MLEGFITGLIAAIVGLFCGFLLAKGLNAFFKAVGVDLPTKGTVLQTRTVVVSLLVGVGITMLATISPARKATNVPPIAAVREGATLAQSRIASSPVTASVVLGLAVLALGARPVRRPGDRPDARPDRPGLHHALRGRGPDLVAVGQAARGGPRGAGREVRRSVGSAGAGRTRPATPRARPARPAR